MHARYYELPIIVVRMTDAILNEIMPDFMHSSVP